MSEDCISDEDGFDPENEQQWTVLAKSVGQIFGRYGVQPDHFEVSGTRFTAFTVDVYIHDFKKYTPVLVSDLSKEIKNILQQHQQYWCVRIIVCKYRDRLDDESGIWLEIDKYQINSFLAKITTERFEDIDSFYRNYWGRCAANSD